MSDQKKSPDAADTLIVGGETLIGDDGKFQSGVTKIDVSPQLLAAIMAQDVPEVLDYSGSYVHDEDLTQAVLATDHAPNSLGHPGDFIPANLHIEEEEGTEHVHDHGDGLDAQQEDQRPFVGGGDWDRKWKPDNLSEPGKNPLGIRNFIGDEFPRMLAYGPPKIGRRVIEENGRKIVVPEMVEKGKPAFWSHWPEGTKPEDMKVIKVNLATKVPDYMKEGTIDAAMKGRSDFAFNGQSLEETFIQLTEKMEKAWRHYAEDFEKTYGIKLDVRRDDAPDAHPEKDVNISVLGFQGGNPRLAGFASFPGGMNEWPQFSALGHQKGFMMLNHEYSNSDRVSETMLYDLILHEMGHFFGWVHPHDLGAMRMSQAEALNSTAMAYTDGHFSKFPGQEGVTAGIVDLGFRNFVANPPEINAENGAVYDLEKRFEMSGGENWYSNVAKTTGMMPAVPILSNGTNTVLKGTRLSDVLDTEPGHLCRVKNPTGVEQRFALVEGHISKVYGRAGNNHIFTSSHGSQEIYPGTGASQIHIYEAGIGNEKTIYSQGKDTLVLHEDIFLQNKKLNMTQNGKDIVISNESGGSIILKDQLTTGKGITAVNIVNDEGKMISSQDVSGFRLNDFKVEIGDRMKRHAERKAIAETQELATMLRGDRPKTKETKSTPQNDNVAGDADKPKGFADRVRKDKNTGTEKSR